MRKTAVLLALVPLLAVAGQVIATMCAIDAVPSATLLVPFFKCDLDHLNGATTLVSVNNAWAEPTVAHVTLWSDWSVHALDFDVYLTGYDTQTLNLCHILRGGYLPVTGAGVGNTGALSAPSVNFPGCGTVAGSPPVYEQPALDESFRAHVQAWLTGQPSPVTGTCAGSNRHNNVAVGYMTIDDVRECSLQFPSDSGYFIDGGTGIASNDNQLWGDWMLVFPANDFAWAETLVHIEAEDGFTGGANGYTFYDRYVGGTGADNREPLGTLWATRYDAGGGLETDVIVWRDSTGANPVPVDCGESPSWHPLRSRQIVAFDQMENPSVSSVGPSGEPTVALEPFPNETQLVCVGTPELPTPFRFGWLFLDLNHQEGNNPFAADPTSAQAWVTTMTSVPGRFSGGVHGIRFDSACYLRPAILP